MCSESEYMSDSDTSSVAGNAAPPKRTCCPDTKMDEVVTVKTKPKKFHCWMCTFCKSKLAVDLTAFIVENSQHMSMSYITEQLHISIVTHSPDAKGAEEADIERHIQHHIVAPEVKMCNMIRSLAAVGETVRLTITKLDADTGELILDTKQVELYLKVMSQIQSAYRTDGKKMLFHAA
jgi:hypothetical protein